MTGANKDKEQMQPLLSGWRQAHASTGEAGEGDAPAVAPQRRAQLPVPRSQAAVVEGERPQPSPVSGCRSRWRYLQSASAYQSGRGSKPRPWPPRPGGHQGQLAESSALFPAEAETPAREGALPAEL